MHPGTGSPRPPSLFSVAGDFLPVPALRKLNPASVTAVRPLAATTSIPPRPHLSTSLGLQ